MSQGGGEGQHGRARGEEMQRGWTVRAFREAQRVKMKAHSTGIPNTEVLFKPRLVGRCRLNGRNEVATAGKS